MLLASFLERAERTLDVAIYDVNLDDETEALVLGTLSAAAARGVRVRFLYNVDRRPLRVPAPPPPKTRPDEIEALPFETRGVPGWPDLMHHKYVVRDGASVWTGSTNWTDDSWSREENVIAVVESVAVAGRYLDDFAQLWTSGRVARTGKVATWRTDGFRVWFTPRRGPRLARRIAHAISDAKRRVRIASPVITGGPILGALTRTIDRGGIDLGGVVDVTQIRDVLRQWSWPTSEMWKAHALVDTLTGAAFSGKVSTPYAPGAVHDYMHAKVTVCDDTVFLGSFNLSHSGESNAENVLEFDDGPLAERLASYVDDLRRRYPPVRLQSAGPPPP